MLFLSLSVLLVVLLFLSIVESSLTHLTRLSLKVLAEKYPNRLLEQIAGDRRGILLPLQFGIQLVLVGITILLTLLFIRAEVSFPWWWAFGSAAFTACLFRQLVPKILATLRSRELLLWFLPLFSSVFLVLRWISLPVWGPISIIDRRRSEKTAEPEEDASEEEIHAYIDVGEEEGIFESTESRLLQSALEFRSTLVREIMTPRDEITAIREDAVMEELKKLIVESKHSRIPVYREQIDQIVGVVYVRNLLTYLENGSEEDPITPIITEVPVIPETKKVPELLEQMQFSAEPMAMVVNEYGTISGLVTIEDLLEEIVGEIRDEDEREEAEIIQESRGRFVVLGGAEIEELEEILGADFGEREAATVSGLIVDRLGRVPESGEKLLIEGVIFEILSADRKKIHKLRVYSGGKDASKGSTE